MKKMIRYIRQLYFRFCYDIMISEWIKIDWRLIQKDLYHLLYAGIWKHCIECEKIFKIESDKPWKISQCSQCFDQELGKLLNKIKCKNKI